MIGRVWVDTGGNLTWTPAQVFDVDLLLLHAGRLPDQTGVVVGVAVGGAHRVLVVTAAVDVTYTPEGGRGQERHGASNRNRKQPSAASGRHFETMRPP